MTASLVFAQPRLARQALGILCLACLETASHCATIDIGWAVKNLRPQDGRLQVEF
jgi:hypothetical protein